MSGGTEKLEALLADVLRLPPSEIQDDLAMKDVESWDSLNHMELISSVEGTFGVELTFDEMVAMTTVGAIKQTLMEKGLVR
jgi:acyl carrier protein